MSKVVIRKMQPQELDDVAEVWWQSLDDSTQWLRPEQKHPVEEAMTFFRKVVAQRCEIWVAERGNEIVGVLAMQQDEIDRMYVATEAQGQGIGSALVDHAKAMHQRGLRLVTLQGNAQACRFYERHGFVAYKTSRSPPPEDEPDVWYRWRSKRN